MVFRKGDKGCFVEFFKFFALVFQFSKLLLWKADLNYLKHKQQFQNGFIENLI